MFCAWLLLIHHGCSVVLVQALSWTVRPKNRVRLHRRNLSLPLLVSSASPAFCFIFPVTVDRISSSSSATTSFITIWEQNATNLAEVFSSLSSFRLYQQCSTVTRSTLFTGTWRWVHKSFAAWEQRLISEWGWGIFFCPDGSFNQPESNAGTRWGSK